MIDLDKLRVFYQVAITGSLTKAVDVLKIKPSSIGRHINDIEKELNVKLFRRHFRGMVLTTHGKKLLISVQSMMDEVSNILNNFDDEETEEFDNRPLRIFTTSGISSLYVVEAVKEFKKEYPNAEVKIECELQTKDFREEHGDFAVLPKVTRSDNLINKKVFIGQAGYYASKQYLNEHGVPQTEKDLINHQCITYRYEKLLQTGAVDTHYNAALQYNSKFKPYLTVNAFPGYLHAATIGMGIIQFEIDHPYIKTFDFIRVLDNVTIDNPIYMTYHINSSNKKIIAIFEKILRGLKK